METTVFGRFCENRGKDVSVVCAVIFTKRKFLLQHAPQLHYTLPGCFTHALFRFVKERSDVMKAPAALLSQRWGIKSPASGMSTIEASLPPSLNPMDLPPADSLAKLIIDA